MRIIYEQEWHECAHYYRHEEQSRQICDMIHTAQDTASAARDASSEVGAVVSVEKGNLRSRRGRLKKKPEKSKQIKRRPSLRKTPGDEMGKFIGPGPLVRQFDSMDMTKPLPARLVDRDILYFDLLAWKSLVQQSALDYRYPLHLMQWTQVTFVGIPRLIRSVIEDAPMEDIIRAVDLRVVMASDSILVYNATPRWSDVRPRDRWLQTLGIELAAAMLSTHLFSAELVHRGALTSGPLYHSNDDPLKLGSPVLFGSGLSEAVQLEQRSNYIGVVVDPSYAKHSNEVATLAGIKERVLETSGIAISKPSDVLHPLTDFILPYGLCGYTSDAFDYDPAVALACEFLFREEVHDSCAAEKWEVTEREIRRLVPPSRLDNMIARGREMKLRGTTTYSGKAYKELHTVLAKKVPDESDFTSDAPEKLLIMRELGRRYRNHFYA